MPNSVSTGFQSWIEETNVGSALMVLTVAGYNYTTFAIEFPKITHDSGKIVGEKANFKLVRQPALAAVIVASKNYFGQTVTCDYGFPTTATSLDMLRLFTGTMESARLQKDEIELVCNDILSRMTDKTIGSDSDQKYFPLDNPATIWWEMAVVYGGLSTLGTTDNPDIDYAAWSSWYTGFDNDSIQIEAFADGNTVLDAMTAIADATDSTIYEDSAGRLVPVKWVGINSVHHTITDSFIFGDIQIETGTDDLVNKVRISIGYDYATQSWGSEITVQNTISVSSWGIHETVYQDPHAYYVSSAAAITFGERIVFRRHEPNAVYTFVAPIRFLPATVGDIVAFTSERVGVSSKFVVVQSTEFDSDDGTIKIKLNEGLGKSSAPFLRGFILDSPVQGLLDQDYNPLIG